jgi:AAA15 family ATPase/GTPase
MTKHLDSLRVQNFRCLKDFTADKLGDVNLIVGKNNSGKSTVLEAVLFFSNEAKGTLLTKIGNFKNEITNNKTLDFIKNFYYNREVTEQDIVISSVNQAEKYVCIQYGYENDKNEFLRQRPQNTLEQIGLTPVIIFKNHEEITDRIYINHKFDCFGFIKHDYLTLSSFKVSYISTGGIDFNFLSSLFDMIQIFPEHKKNIIDVLKTIEPSIEDFGFFDKQDFNLFGTKQDNKSRFVQLRLSNGQLVPMKSMGDGISTIFNILINAYNAKDGILLIDEVENGLHFSVQKQVWQVLFDLSKKLEMQIFATTHSWDAIEAFAQVSKENTLKGVLMRMGKSGHKDHKDEVIATIYDENALYDITQQEIEVR